jgi:hypothetical protein
MRTRLIVALFIAVCSNIPSLVAVGFAQSSQAEQERIQGLIDFARRSGQRLAIGARACESLGLSPIGDCEVLQVLHIDPAVFRGKEPAGTRHALSVFEEPGAARRWVLVAKELEGGAAVMSLLDQNGAPRRAVRRNNRTDAWLPFSLELNPAVLTVLGEVTYWLKQAKDAPK